MQEYRNIAIDVLLSCWARCAHYLGKLPSDRLAFQTWLADLMCDAMSRHDEISNGGVTDGQTDHSV